MACLVAEDGKPVHPRSRCAPRLPASLRQRLEYRDAISIAFLAAYMLPEMRGLLIGFGSGNIFRRLNREAPMGAIRRSIRDTMEARAHGMRASGLEDHFADLMQEAGALDHASGLEAVHGAEPLHLYTSSYSGGYFFAWDSGLEFRAALRSLRIEGNLNRFAAVSAWIERSARNGGVTEDTVTRAQAAQIDLALLDDPALDPYTTDAYAAALETLITQRQPEALLLADGATGLDVAPVLAQRLGTGFVADVVGIEADAQEGFVFTREPYSGKVLADVAFAADARPMVVTVRPKAFEPDAPVEGRTAPVLMQHVDGFGDVRQTVADVVRRASGRVELTEADIVVSGGRGTKGAEGFALVEELADVLGVDEERYQTLSGGQVLPNRHAGALHHRRRACRSRRPRSVGEGRIPHPAVGLRRWPGQSSRLAASTSASRSRTRSRSTRT